MAFPRRLASHVWSFNFGNLSMTATTSRRSSGACSRLRSLPFGLIRLIRIDKPKRWFIEEDKFKNSSSSSVVFGSVPSSLPPELSVDGSSSFLFGASAERIMATAKNRVVSQRAHSEIFSQHFSAVRTFCCASYQPVKPRDDARSHQEGILETKVQGLS